MSTIGHFGGVGQRDMNNTDGILTPLAMYVSKSHQVIRVAPAAAFVCWFLSGGIPACGTEGTPEPHRGTTARMALLIGVEEYPNLGFERQLRGARNDVKLVKGLLVDRFGFLTENVIELIDSEATGEGIRRAIDDLAARVRMLPRGDGPAEVVLFFSGHGSQVPDQEDGHPDCDELDGLDETLVPYDAVVKGSKADVRDDELYRLAGEICADERARLWVVLDCCHSGTGVRGVTRVRQLRRGFTTAPSVDGGRRRIVPKVLPPGAIALSACRPFEVEPEYQRDGQSYGLLTMFLVRTLRQTPALSRVSYLALREMVIDQYRQAAVVPAPLPQLEGHPKALGRSVLGASPAMDGPYFWRASRDERDPGRVQIAAGALHGVTAGSLYALFERRDHVPPRLNGFSADGGPRPVAWLEIDRAGLLEASAKSFEWAGQQKTYVALPRAFSQGLAVKRYHDHGDALLRIGVARVVGGAEDRELAPTDPDVPLAVRMCFDGGARQDESGWLRWAEPSGPSDLILRIDGGLAALFPATGLPFARSSEESLRDKAGPTSLLGGWGPFDLANPAEAADELITSLRRIDRARDLIRIVSLQASTQEAKAPKLDLMEVLELGESSQILRTQPWPLAGQSAPCVPEGRTFALRVSHPEPTGSPMYVTVLAIDPDMEIIPVIPHQAGIGLDEEQRLNPGGSLLSLPYRCTKPFGPQYAIAFATPEPNDLFLLAQPHLDRVRGLRGSSTLGELLQEHLYIQTRGRRRPQPQKTCDDSWAAGVLRWDAVPEP